MAEDLPKTIESILEKLRDEEPESYVFYGDPVQSIKFESDNETGQIVKNIIQEAVAKRISRIVFEFYKNIFQYRYETKRGTSHVYPINIEHYPAVLYCLKILFGHDITLRDGEQQAGIALRKDEKIKIAVKLAEAGVHRIETGMPATSKDDELAIRELVKI